MKLNRKHREAVLAREFRTVEKQEKKIADAAQKVNPSMWKQELESRIPPKIYVGLESAFCKGFEVVFHQGQALIEKGYDKEKIQADYAVRDFAVQRIGGRKNLKQMHKSAKQANLINLAETTVEGVGLGALGVGMPDIVLFLGNLLKGIYETALNYGFHYESRREQFLILKMMQAALSDGENWIGRNGEVEKILALETADITEDEFRQQVRDTASVFAMDMLMLKFIQGLPVVGILGGAANPIYYSKVMKYVELKYRKRYLLKRMSDSGQSMQSGGKQQFRI